MTDADSPSTMLAGKRLLGRYRLLRSLGVGSAGRVYLAEDTAAGGQSVALKLVAAAHAERLAWEFSVLRKLSHPALAAVHEVLWLPAGATGSAAAALVEDYVPGQSAELAVQSQALERPLRVRWVLSLGAQIASALAAVHRAGLVHGDVKPDNILVDTGGLGKLVDLGMARRPGVYGDVSGTPGYMAPELLVGQVGTAADLYALGATLLALVTGRQWGQDMSSSTADAGEILRLTPAPPPRWLPAAFRELLADLLRPEHVERPHDAQVVAGRLAQLAAEASGGHAAAPLTQLGERSSQERIAALASLPLVGRDVQRLQLQEYIARGDELVAVVGPAGSGHSRLVREAVSERQLQAAQAAKPAPTFLQLDAVPASVPELSDAIVYLSGTRAEPPWDALASLQRAARVAGQRQQWIVGCELAHADQPHVLLTRLTPAEMAVLLRAALPDEEWSDAMSEQVTQLVDGLPGRLCALIAEGLAEGADLSRLGTWSRLADKLATELGSTQQEASLLQDVLQLCGGAVSATALRMPSEQIAGELEALRRKGWIRDRADGRVELGFAVRINGDLDWPAVRLSTALSCLDLARLDPLARAFAALAAGHLAEAANAFSVAMSQQRARGDVEDAVRTAQMALARGAGGELARQLSRDLADGLRAMADYQAAQAALAPVAQDDRAAQAMAAELSRLVGERDAARALAEPLAKGEDEPAAAALACMARLSLDTGDLNEAQRQARAAQVVSEAGSGAHLRGVEVEALAQALLGEAEQAQHRLVGALNQTQEPVHSFRLHAALAYVHATAGQRAASVEHNRRAAELADAVGELHGAAVARVNAGSAALERGQLAVAIMELQAGASRLCRLGRDADVWQALYNLALARSLVGDSNSAEWLLSQARDSAARVGAPYAAAVLGSFAAELALSRGQVGQARNLLQSCPHAEGHPQHVAVMVLGRLIEVAAGLGQKEQAQQLVVELDAVAQGSQVASTISELALARGRLAALKGDGRQARDWAREAVEAARETEQFEVQLRSLLFLVRCYQEQDDYAGSRRTLSELRTMLEQAGQGLASELLARMRATPIYQAAFATVPEAQESGAAASMARGRAERLLVHAKRFLADPRSSRVFEKVLDAAIELSAVERGYLVTVDGDGDLRIRAARGLSQTSLPRDAKALSSSIVGQVLLSGRPLSTTDAMTDLRLSSASSVHALSLRSVAALPLFWSGKIRGAVYLEDRLRPHAFDAALLSLLSDLTSLAGAAIEAAQLLQGQRRTLRRLSVARLRLARQLEAQAVELQSLRESQGDPGSAYGMIGHNPAFLRVLALASRAAPSDLPILIYGESGTGKELLARAVHVQSSRANGPFIAENCSAVPESLLESTLFGHVRGAFTGADRNRRGLFELADGGTLFLDELGEMPLSMQVRLLRVLQDGEVRAVGAERGRKVNVRVVAATHRDLPTLIMQGAFREDLYYRLAVVTLMLPALRERPEDIPELAAYFAAQHATGRAVQIDRRALNALCSYAWPGNVRQLENEIRRALMLADDRIAESHLSRAIIADAGSTIAPLDLHGQVASLERRLLNTALSQTSGNQSRAAERLGLSRYGLQKMMRRLGIELPSA